MKEGREEVEIETVEEIAQIEVKQSLFGTEYRKKAIVISILVFLIILLFSCIVFTIFYTSREENDLNNSNNSTDINVSDNTTQSVTEKFTFDDMFRLYPNFTSIQWVQVNTNAFGDLIDAEEGWVEQDWNEGSKGWELNLYYFPSSIFENGNLNTQTQPQKYTLYPSANYPQTSSSFILSNDGEYILFSYDYQQIYRHSYYARWEVCSVITYECWPLIPDDNSNDIRLVLWNSLQSIMYVRGNNVYVYKEIEDLKAGNSAKQVTNDGEINKVINGAPDWVYEEEILESNSASYFNNNYIAYLRFEEENVNNYSFPIYSANNVNSKENDEVIVGGNGALQYPYQFSYKYPCPSTSNSIVTLWIYSLLSDQTFQVDLNVNDLLLQKRNNNNENNESERGRGKREEWTEFYITSIDWVDETTLAYRIIDRLQQHQKLIFVTIDENNTNDLIKGRIITEQDDPCYLEPHNNLLFVNTLNLFVDMVIEDNYYRFVLFSMNGDVVRTLTNGEFDVDDLLGFDESKNILYFTTHQESPQSKHVYSIDLSTGNRDESLPIRITSIEDGGYFDASFSPSFLYYLLINYGPNVPQTSMKFAADHSLLYMVNSNEEFAKEIGKKNMPTKIFVNFTAENGDVLPAFILLPYQFNETEKYPVLMNFYGGPGSQEVNFIWTSSSWYYHTYLSSNFNFIIVMADNRGTGYFGQSYLKQTYRQLGVLEARDQLAVARQLTAFPYVDPSRIAIWGWSFGGFLSSMISTSNDPIISVAVAVAPVIDWSFYDSVYTERYMQNLQSNPNGYRYSSLFGRAKYAPPKTDYLLVHGTADDNVHFQNTADWITELVNVGNNNFRVMVYPDKSHSLSGEPTRRHLFNLITKFILSKFNL